MPEVRASASRLHPLVEDAPVWIAIVTFVAGVAGGAWKIYRRWRDSRAHEKNRLSRIEEKVDAALGFMRDNRELILRVRDDQSRQQVWKEVTADRSPVPTWEADKEGACTYVNPAYEALVGRRAESLLGHGWQDIIAPDDYRRVVARWGVCVAQGSVFVADFRTVGGVSIHCVGRPYHDHDGVLAGYHGSWQIMEGGDG